MASKPVRTCPVTPWKPTIVETRLSGLFPDLLKALETVTGSHTETQPLNQLKTTTSLRNQVAGNNILDTARATCRHGVEIRISYNYKDPINATYPQSGKRVSLFRGGYSSFQPPGG